MGSRMSETSFAPFGNRKGINLIPGNMFKPGNHHLRDSFARVQQERGIRKIDQDNPDFSPVIGINGTGGIYNGDTVFGGKPAAGSNLGFVAFG